MARRTPRRRARPVLPKFHAPAPGARQDAGPAERYRHGDVIQREPGDAAGVFYHRNVTQCVLDRYLVRGQIDQRQFDAGLKLYRLWRASGAAQRIIASYSPRVRAQREMSDDQAVLRGRVTDTLRRMGPLADILVHVCLCDEAARDWAVGRGDAPQAGMAVLRMALESLADYWRL